MHASDHRFAHVPGWLSAVARSSTTEPDIDRRVRDLGSAPLLQGLSPDALWRLAAGAVEHTFEPGQIIHDATNADGKMWARVIMSGCCDVVRRDESAVIECLAEHDWCGDIGIMSSAPADALIRAAGRENCRVFSFDAVMFQGIIAEQILILKMMAHGGNATASDPIDVRELGVFSDLPMRDLGMLINDATHERHEAGSTIIRQGDAGDRFYVILDGDVTVDRDGHELAHLHRGQYFGETALIFDCARTATVRASRPTTTWSISRSTFSTIVRHYLLEQRLTRDSIGSRMRTSA